MSIWNKMRNLAENLKKYDLYGITGAADYWQAQDR